MMQLIPFFFLLPAILVVAVVVFLIRQWMNMRKRGEPGYDSDDDSPSYQMSSPSNSSDDGDGSTEP